ncbi:MAG: DNA polymerase domain-containing protein [Firmicutes bacterium]|nr:DNA polymerase domain-containing protein [Bacillota bacterium]
MKDYIDVDGYKVKLTNLNKILWPKLGIKKFDYIEILINISHYIIPHTKDRILTVIRYPDGVKGKSFYQKKVPNYAPDWIDLIEYKGSNYINLNKRATLVWLGNLASLEFHVTFNKYQNNNPSYLVFDLDPSKDQKFNEVIEISLIIYDTLKALGIKSYVKTSGKSGLQIYIPTNNKYNYNEIRKLNKFFGLYFSQKYPSRITIERNKKKRDNRLYFDYLQTWNKKTIVSVYSPRANEYAGISMPIKWSELKKGIEPKDFNLLNVNKRLKEYSDLFINLEKDYNKSLDDILKRI